MIRAAIFVVILTMLGTGGYFIYNVIAEKAALEVKNQVQTDTIMSLRAGIEHMTTAMTHMRDDFIKSEKKANEQKKRFDLKGMEKLIRTDPKRAASVAYNSTDVLFSEIEARRRDFKGRGKAKD